MKNYRLIIAAIFIGATVTGCGHSGGSANSSADSASSPTKKAGDTAIVGGSQNIKSDSVSGDPTSKGNADPNAHLPKK